MKDSANVAKIVSDILQERWRQQEVEFFNSAHDDEHTDFSLALAAACYADCASWSEEKRHERITMPFIETGDTKAPSWWPWSNLWWRPSTRRRELVKAAALIIAELERLDRNNVQ